MKKEDAQGFIWECRRTKIELQHEMLVRQMDAILVAMVGLPITVFTLMLQSQVYQNQSVTILLIYGFATAMVLVEFLREDRSDKITAKQKELDQLANEVALSCE